VNKFLNKRKFYLNYNKFLILIIIIIFVVIITAFNIYNITSKFEIYFIKKINKFSENYNYQLNSSHIEGLEILKIDEVDDLIKKYYNKSIFLIPLETIFEEIREINWVKNLSITTNLKNKIIIKIEEYKPVGIYIFNQEKYYFDYSGKIIDSVNNTNLINKNFITFSGPSSILIANSVLDIFNDFNVNNQEKISSAIYINKRRWNIILSNGLIIKLSEDYPNNSINNYLKLRKKLNNNELNNIESIDLREFQKAIIELK
tara:strand:- start:12114 stop:12890 length:777 start_codon:yes stop_codon:yes gene_type:complete